MNLLITYEWCSLHLDSFVTAIISTSVAALAPLWPPNGIMALYKFRIIIIIIITVFILFLQHDLLVKSFIVFVLCNRIVFDSEQFEVCLDMFQEAYKAVEDIHNLIVLAKKPPRPSLMANYLQKFGLVLYKSDNFMFHACAWHRLFHLYREQRKSVSEHELQKYGRSIWHNLYCQCYQIVCWLTKHMR